jgi:enediyne polyketide synthase
VDVALRVHESGFQFNHFEASCVWDEEPADRRREGVDGRVDLDPVRDVYGKILFHRGRFRRVAAYRRLRSIETVAEISPSARDAWFGPYLPQTLILGDPGSRDAAIHSLQAAIPHARILPSGAERVIISPAGMNHSGTRLAFARERSRTGHHLVFDLVITDDNEAILEEWQGLQLTSVEPLEGAGRDGWPAPLLAAYLERRVADILDCRVTVALSAGSTAEVLQKAGSAVAGYRPDGKPEGRNGTVSGSHSGRFTLAVSSSGAAACDMQAVEMRQPDTWHDLLGPERFRLAQFISRERAEDASTVATRVWTATECLRKAGAAVDAPLGYCPNGVGDCVQFTSGSLRIATFVLRVADADQPLAFAILARAA